MERRAEELGADGSREHFAGLGAAGEPRVLKKGRLPAPFKGNQSVAVDVRWSADPGALGSGAREVLPAPICARLRGPAKPFSPRA